MNKNIKLAVAGAVLALSASAANAGIVIPAGEWTIDINGNVNAYMINNNSTKGRTAIGGGLAQAPAAASNNGSSINTGLLPSWLGFTGKTRQNDLDVSWTISFQPGASSNDNISGGGGAENRQAALTFGDKSWGSIKLGKDLGVFGSDAILNDMTLLGVGSQGIVGAQGGSTTTLGRIGTGYQYADWKGQFAYSTPNMNGFEATVAIVHPWNATSANIGTVAVPVLVSASTVGTNQNNFGYEGKASYSYAANDVTAKVWVEGISQRVKNVGAGNQSSTAYAGGIGAKVAVSFVELVGYYYDGEGNGTTGFLRDGFDVLGSKRDSNGGYVQALVTLPTKTKVGASWGTSNLDATAADIVAARNIVKENEMWTIGAYHPLTKSLNIVAEYSQVTAKGNAAWEAAAAANRDNESDIVSVGGILFF